MNTSRYLYYVRKDFIVIWYRYITFINKKCDIVIMAHITIF